MNAMQSRNVIGKRQDLSAPRDSIALEQISKKKLLLSSLLPVQGADLECWMLVAAH